MKTFLFYAVCIAVGVLGVFGFYALMPEGKELKPYDPQAVVEDCATVVFNRDLRFTAINGGKVKIRAGYAKNASFIIPAGDYELKYDYRTDKSSATGMKIECTLQKGRIYELKYRLEDKMIYTHLEEITQERYDEILKNRN